MLKLDSHQIHAISQQRSRDAHEQAKATVCQAWPDVQARLWPMCLHLSPPQVEAWVDACYEDCIKAQVDSTHEFVRYSLAVLRALHLGAGQRFIAGLRRHFTGRPGCAASSLIWIEHVLYRVHLRRAAQARAGLDHTHSSRS